VSETNVYPGPKFEIAGVSLCRRCQKSSQAPPVVDSMHYVEENETEF
jgi:hypothetical protein